MPSRYFVMIDHDTTAAEADTLHHARAAGHDVAAREPLPCDVSLYAEHADGALELLETLRTLADWPTETTARLTADRWAARHGWLGAA
jgi:hypothetical protein